MIWVKLDLWLGKILRKLSSIFFMTLLAPSSTCFSIDPDVAVSFPLMYRVSELNTPDN